MDNTQQHKSFSINTVIAEKHRHKDKTGARSNCPVTFGLIFSLDTGVLDYMRRCIVYEIANY